MGKVTQTNLADPRPRLLFVAPYFFPRNYGGAVQIYDGLLRRLHPFDITVLTEEQGADPAARAQFDAAAPAERGYRVVRLPRLALHFATRNPLRRALELVRFFRAAGRDFDRALAELAPDLVICGATFSTGWLMRRLPPGLRFVNYIHGEELTMRRGFSLLDRALIRGQLAALRAAPLNLVVSRYSAATLAQVAGVPPARIHVLPNAIDTGRFAPPPTPDQRTADRTRFGWQTGPVLLTIARLIPRKGIAQVLHALALLQRQNALPPDWRYAIGGRGPEEQSLRRLAAELGLAERVQFLGFIADEELAACYGAADLFILTNREIEGDTEGFGIVFLEANACGTPVIGGIAGGTADAIAEGVSGLRVDGDNVAAIAGALRELLNDPARRARLARAGLERARQDFSLAARARELESLLQRLLHLG